MSTKCFKPGKRLCGQDENDRPWLRHYPSDVPPSLNYPQSYPVTALLIEKAEQVPEKVFTVYKDQVITYRQMDALTDVLAWALVVDLGIKKGDRVALFLPNLPQFVLAFFGVLKAGGVVTAMNPAYKEGEVLFRLKRLRVQRWSFAWPAQLCHCFNP